VASKLQANNYKRVLKAKYEVLTAALLIYRDVRRCRSVSPQIEFGLFRAEKETNRPLKRWDLFPNDTAMHPRRLQATLTKILRRFQNYENRLLVLSGVYIYIYLSVCLSACPPSWNTSAPTDRILMKFNI
jgi:hypothetical protein